MNIFEFNGYEVVLNQPEILLVPEFKALWDEQRNKCKEDKTGKKRLRAYKEFTYIYMLHDWQSPYADYIDEKEKLDTLMEEYDVTLQDLADPLFQAASAKYQKLQSTIKVELLLAAKQMACQLIVFFKTVDLMDRADDGKYYFTSKEAIANLKEVGNAVEGLDTLIEQVRKEREASQELRGGSNPGIFD